MIAIPRFFLVVLALFSFNTVAEEGVIAGLRPYARPQGAPVIESFEQLPAWRERALRGIVEPQTGVGFLKDQGAWYTPFTRPNLLGRYDIRGLHRNDDKKD